MSNDLLLSATLQSSALFVVVWALLRLFPWIPTNAKTWIWRFAFLKPLVAFVPILAFTLHVLPVAEVPVLKSISSVTSVHSGAPAPIHLPAEPDIPIDIDPLIAAWLVGALVVAGVGLRNLDRARCLARSAKSVTDPELLSWLQEIGARGGISSKIHLLYSWETETALVLGGLRPRIILPAAVVQNGVHSDARLMVAHELAHLVRRDIPWLGLTWVVQSLFFFNPLVWVAAHCAREAHESATDELTTKLAATPVNVYADMLLRASTDARSSLIPGAIPMAESFRTIRRRLDAMKRFNRKPTPWVYTTTLFAVGLTVMLLPNIRLAEAAQASPPQIPTEKFGRVKDMDPKYPDNVSCEFQQFDGREALQMLFTKFHKSFAIDPRVQGKVTVSMQNVTLETAILNMSRQMDATYKLQSGTYSIFPRPAEIQPAPTKTIPGPPVTIDLKKLHRVSFKYVRFDVRESLRRLFQGDMVSYTIAPTVQGTVTLSLNNATFEDALKNLLRQVRATYRIENGVINVVSVDKRT